MRLRSRAPAPTLEDWQDLEVSVTLYPVIVAKTGLEKSCRTSMTSRYEAHMEHDVRREDANQLGQCP